MLSLPSTLVYLSLLTNATLSNSLSLKTTYTFLYNSRILLKGPSRSKFVLFKDPLIDPSSGLPLFKYEHPKYPPYPYYDAPRNLFFNVSKLKKAKGDDDDPKALESDVQKEYMRNASLRRANRVVKPPDKTPLSELKRAIDSDFNDYVFNYQKPHREKIKTDMAEYDNLNPGLGPWPSYEQLKEKDMNLNTSMFFELDPNDPLEKQLQHKPLRRNDVKTIAEAREEQKRWLDRSRNKEWALTYNEFSSLPLDMREAYYENRYPVSDQDERFLMVLNYRKSITNKSHRKNPMQFDLLESDYTYTPKESPVMNDLKNWDDPLDCAWRLRANEAIRDCVTYGWPPKDVRFDTGMGVYDITWLPGVVKILVERTRNECGNINRKELTLMLMKLEKRLEQLDKEEHTEVMENHLVVLCTHPENNKTLHSRREWNENSGKKVAITMNDDKRTQYHGVLLGSDNAFGIHIKLGENKLTLPLPFVFKFYLKYMNEEVIDVDSVNSLCEFEEFDLYTAFAYFNDLCFDGFLQSVRVSWSKRLTLSAGICEYKGYCEIKISESILKYRTAKECKETLLHEMIHAYLFLNNRDLTNGHGKEFIWHMNRVNEITGLNVTVFHEFYDEVDYLRKHIWRCNGPCRLQPPYFGYVKRSRNLAPGPRDLWWERHRKSCNGVFIKVSGDPNLSTKKRARRDKKIHSNTIDKYLEKADGGGEADDDPGGSSSRPIAIVDE